MSLLRRFWFSVAGTEHYPALVAQGARQAVGYLLVLVLTIAVLRTAGRYGETKWVLDGLARAVVTWPDFRLADGRFTFAGEMPYVFADKSLTVIVDTTGRTGPDALEASPSESGCLLTATHVFLKGSTLPANEISWRDIPVRTSRNKLARDLPRLLWPVLALTLLCLIVYTAVAKTLSLFALGLAGWLATGARDLRYGRAATVAAYALTGPIILALAKDFYPTGFPGAYLLTHYFRFIYWGTAVIWVIMASRTVRNSLAPPTPSASAPERHELELI